MLRVDNVLFPHTRRGPVLKWGAMWWMGYALAKILGGQGSYQLERMYYLLCITLVCQITTTYCRVTTHFTVLMLYQTLEATFSWIFIVTVAAECQHAELSRIKQQYFRSKNRTRVSNVRPDVFKKSITKVNTSYCSPINRASFYSGVSRRTLQSITRWQMMYCAK